MPTLTPPADEAQVDPGATGTVEQTAQSALNLAMALDDDLAKLRSTVTTVMETADAAFGQLTGLDVRLERGAENIMEQVTAMMVDAVQGANAKLEQAEIREARLADRVAALEAGGSSMPHAENGVVVPGRVHMKVLELMRSVEAIGKDKQANAGDGGRFKFRGIDAAMDAVGHAMRQVGLTLETAILAKDYDQNPVTRVDKDGNPKTVVWTTAKLTVRYTFVDPTDGSRHNFEMAGEGRDASDKSTSKAESMALKYGLFQALMIPVEGMADADTESPQVVSDQPQQPAPAPPEKPKSERARDAWMAMRNINRVEPSKREAHLDAIGQRIKELDLWRFEVEGSTLQAHWVATKATILPPVPPPPADDYPPSF